jgi:hypothetical protein
VGLTKARRLLYFSRQFILFAEHGDEYLRCLVLSGQQDCVHHLTYLSQAMRPVSTEVLPSVVDQARQANAQHLTGALFYRNERPLLPLRHPVTLKDPTVLRYTQLTTGTTSHIGASATQGEALGLHSVEPNGWCYGTQLASC